MATPECSGLDSSETCSSIEQQNNHVHSDNNELDDVSFEQTNLEV